jgi:hypothetical protein
MYTLPEGTAWATLYVVNIAGAPLFEAPLDPHQTRYEWDLTADFGHKLGSGLYLYVVASEKGSSTVGRLVIER